MMIALAMGLVACGRASENSANESTAANEVGDLAGAANEIDNAAASLNEAQSAASAAEQTTATPDKPAAAAAPRAPVKAAPRTTPAAQKPVPKTPPPAQPKTPEAPAPPACAPEHRAAGHC
jgi:hypothetical protein